LCVWVTGPAGVFATAVRALVWENLAVFTPEPLPYPEPWFCSISSERFGPLSVAFSFCVIGPDPVAFEVSVWLCVSADEESQSHTPVVGFFTGLPTELLPAAA